jgi:hypothetical protein
MSDGGPYWWLHFWSMFTYRFFASAAIGFRYFTVLGRMFCDSLKQISEWKEQMNTINWITIFGHKYVDWTSLKP